MADGNIVDTIISIGQVTAKVLQKGGKLLAPEAAGPRQTPSVVIGQPELECPNAEGPGSYARLSAILEVTTPGFPAKVVDFGGAERDRTADLLVAK